MSQDNMRVLADEWRNLSSLKKLPYAIRAEQDARRYQQEVGDTVSNTLTGNKATKSPNATWIVDMTRTTCRAYRTELVPTWRTTKKQ